MERKDFGVFCTLFSDVYAKAFGEPLSRLPHGKAQSLSWMIYESTGEMLSYKSLGNYVASILDDTPHKINPSGMTLSILAQFVNGLAAPTCGGLAWYKYRSQVLSRPMAA